MRSMTKTMKKIVVMKIKSDVVVIGAGAAGMMAAGHAAKRGLDVILIERNDRPGRKLMITGKGRCNLTNDCSLNEFMENVPWGGKFLYGAFSRFEPREVMAFFEELGVPLKVERGRRVFPQSDKAVNIVDALKNFTVKSGCRMVHGRVKSLMIKDSVVSGVKLENGDTIEARAVIVCTGGKSYSQTGSTGDGYDFARQAGHTVMPLRPSLIPVETVEEWPRDLQGLSLRNVTLELREAKRSKVLYNELGEMLFTHFGVTGPLVLSASAHMRDIKAIENAGYHIHIDLKPALSIEQLDKRLQRDLLKYANRDFINSLGELLPAKLIPVFASLSGIAPQTKANQITKEQRLSVANLLKNLKLTVKSLRPIEEAVVTSGGVKLSEINPSTMESKLVSGLYFAGEVIDADAFTGGYNLQIAFCTGHSAGMSVLGE
jgi:predicted Rossmann fold flavoprotein